MCKFCEKDKKNKFKPIVKRFDSFNGYEKIELQHVLPCEALPNRDEWHLSVLSFGACIYAQINYCPMCGRKLGDTDK